MSYDLNHPFVQDHRIGDAVAACKEEIELEALVGVVGGHDAQEAVKVHQLPQFIAETARP